MIKKIILAGILILIIIGGIIAAAYYANFRTVTFTLEKQNYEVIVSDNEDNQIATLTQSSSLRLQDGDYLYIINGENYSQEPVLFSVKGEDSKISVQPEFSTQYLGAILEREQDAIRATIQEAYQDKPAFTIQSLNVYEDGNWAAGTLIPNADPRQLPDIYRLVLYKDAETKQWRIIIPPTIAIDKNTYKNVPSSILYALYSA